MNKQLIIPCTKMVLVLDEGELIRGMPTDILQKAILKGKGFRRAETTAKRGMQGFNRWELYETLKGTRKLDDLLIKSIETMPAAELREGVIEYLLTQKRAS